MVIVTTPAHTPKTAPLRDALWSGIADIYGEILCHPFVEGLADGSLPRESFTQYVVQDAYYLRDYARALAIVAAKAPDETIVRRFCEDAAGAIAVEQSLHTDFLGALGLTENEAMSRPVPPTTLAYTSYLLRVCHQGSFAEGLAAVLPCYWIYARVGEKLVEKSSPDPLYARWITMYGGEDFQQVVARVLELVDRIGESLSDNERARVTERVVTAARYEWMFWDAAWRLETWPV